MKKLIMLLVMLVSLVLLVACNSGGNGGTLGGTNLQLLRIETDENSNGYFRSTASANGVRKIVASPLDSRNGESQVEEIDSTYVNLVAVIKNEDRASFIDMVVYNSQNDKKNVQIVCTNGEISLG